MLLSWYSNAPWAPTGYGTQTAQVTRRLAADGHDVAVLANYGLTGTMLDWDTVTVYPGGVDGHSTDVVEDQHRDHLDGRPGWVITLYDVWVLGETFADANVASWVPIDSAPVSPPVLDWCRRHRSIAMSKWGQEELRKQGVESTYIPHAVERVFHPTPSDAREQLGIPEDAFLVMINAANQSLYPPRKAWWEMLAGLGAFFRKHDDVYLYLNADLQRPNGVNIPFWAVQVGIPFERLSVTNRTVYRTTGFSQEKLAQLYTTADVLLATSMGEGFGLPVIEAQACGTPVIVTDFSAQPELVGAGWKVPYQPTPYYQQANFLGTPSIPAITEALEAAYNARGSVELRARAMAKAAEYDADTVYAEKWRPYLAELEAELQPRKGMSRAAQKRERRQRRAA